MRFLRLLMVLVCAAFAGTGAGSFADEAAAPANGIQDTGDRVEGLPVITSLAVENLPTGRHDYYFRAGWRNTGAPIHVPVAVVKGAAEGTRLMLTAAVHGDELNGIGVLHKLLASLDAATLKGTVIAVPGVNPPGIMANNRRFPVSTGGGSLVDLNRNFPGRGGDEGSIAGRYVGALWEGLIKPNADIAVDLHTQTRGSAYPLFVFADFGNYQAKAAAFALGPDMIKNDSGQEGTVETSLVKEGIPAVTFEVGAPKVFQRDLIDRAVWGLRNLMRSHHMLAGKVEEPPVKPIVGSAYTNVFAGRGGIAVLHVGLKERVARGQVVATLYDAFGRELEKYTAPHDGWVLAVATDPMREAGSMLVRILR
ncbi:MAG: succinylglutamate desuccinylase/aspartoacylase family protein [Alphaproteobacteria bacterium]|nr:succinylglutamate desuccinylase/aspartoacylase family protein [Alphaproteobacteria bacterium]